MALIGAKTNPRGSRYDLLGRRAAELVNVNAAMDLNAALSAAGVATATVTSKAKIVNTLTYLSGGVFKSKGAADNFWTLGGAGSATTVAAASFQKYVLCIDATGAAPTVFEGVQSVVNAASVAWTNVAGQSPWAPLLTILNAGYTIVSTLTIATDATHTFIPGTTLLGAAGITATFVDGMDQSLMPVMQNLSGVVIGIGG